MQPDIIKNLEKARRLTFPEFANIVLEPAAVKILVNLFIHPGCKSDVNLASFLTGQPVGLTEISPHIITAFPAQVARFAARKKKLRITGSDLLECFAIDHADAVEENIGSLQFEPSYALAHVLTVGRIKEVKAIENRQLVELEVKVCGQKVNFSHVLAPPDLPVLANQTVFHHFGVIVAVVDELGLKKLANKLQAEQNGKSFLQKIVKQVMGKEIKEIDYARVPFFKVDMTGQLIQETKKDFDFQRLWQEEDLKNIKLPKEAEVMFSS